MSAEQERADFKTALFDILIKYHSQTMDIGQGKGHSVSVCMPECTPMKDAASFFYSMILRYRAAHFTKDSVLMFTGDSINIGYDGVYQCLQAGVMVYEG